MPSNLTYMLPPVEELVRQGDEILAQMQKERRVARRGAAAKRRRIAAAARSTKETMTEEARLSSERRAASWSRLDLARTQCEAEWRAAASKYGDTHEETIACLARYDEANCRFRVWNLM